MPKVLRPGEKITVTQTRAPAEMWRYCKRLALDYASDGTLAQLCTGKFLEWVPLRTWAADTWRQPRNVVRDAGPTGFIQANLPFSNLDAEGQKILTDQYLEAAGVLPFVNQNKLAYRAMKQSEDASRLPYLLGEVYEVSGATVAYTFLHWLTVNKFPPRPIERAESAPPAAAFDASSVPESTLLRRFRGTGTVRGRQSS